LLVPVPGLWIALWWGHGSCKHIIGSYFGFTLQGALMTTQYDAIIIGTGQAGPSLAVRLAGARMKVAIIKRKRFGGTCVNTGCIPTKTLVASARAAHIARRAAEYGVTIEKLDYCQHEESQRVQGRCRAALQ
jgi:pyruvate/2-oxoglutarate dehydrogenase complex dihydrolipoamide dehydrogenase (E3) component